MVCGMRFRILGSLDVRDDTGRALDLGGPKQRAVLASLLVAQGRPVSVDRLTEQVWADEPPANPETSLQAYVSNLRRSLEPDRKPREAPRLLVTRPAGYALLADRAAVDATAFEDEVGAGRDALAAGDAAGGRELLQRALDRWAGPPLPELAGAGWVDEATSWLTGLYRQALDARFDAGLRLGEHAELMPRIERAVAEHPYNERLRAQHALALYRSGRQRDALAALDAARAVLREEVGVDPGPELRRLEADILAQSPALDLAPALGGTRSPGGAGRGGHADGGEGGDGADGGEGGDGSRPGDLVGRPATAGRPGPAAVAGHPAEAGAGHYAAGARPFVGRRQELDALLQAAAVTESGAGRPVVVCGEPGIGKTRLVEELIGCLPATTVAAWGRCPESAASAAYWPCIQVGRQLEGAGVIPGDLAAELLPDDDIDLLDVDPTAGRLHVHLAVAKLLAASTHPVVAVVDDLQWADAASLRLLEFVAGELRSMPLLLVVTVRPTGPDAAPPLVDCLAELARQPGALRIDLDGLSGDDVRRWLAGRAAGPVDPQVAALVHDRTGGNPFFVGEVVELLTGAGRPIDAEALRRGTAVPGAVQDVVRRRVSRLPVETQQVLTVASVVGRTFDLDVVAAVGERPLAQMLDLLDPAAAAGLVDELDVPGRFQFSHALVAETLAAEVTAGRRARLHAATARALATLRSADLEGHLADVAHHAVEGALAGTADEAYEWSVLAARQAAGRRAHEECAEHWRRAARALELARPADTAARFDALEEEGLAWLRVDAVDAGYEVLARAIDLGIAMDRPDLVARASAAMNVEGVWNTGEVALGGVDAASVLERALAYLPDTPTVERVLAAGAMAEAAYWMRPPEWQDEVTRQAVADARRLGDPLTLGRSLHKRNQALWRAASLDERAEAADELFAMAVEHGLPPTLEAMARFGIAGIRWERAEVAGAVEQASIAQRLAHQLGSPALMTQLDWFVSTMTAFRGRLAEAEAMCDRAYELYRRTRRWSADTLDAGLRLSIFMEQGRLDDIRARADVLLDSPYRPWFQEGYAYGLVQFGCLDEAAAVLEGSPLPPLVDCWMYLGLVAAATHVRVALGDRQAVATLIGELRPYEGRLAVTGTGSAFGDVHLALAAGSRLLGDDEAARHHADRSVDVLATAGSGPDLVRALLLRAEVAPEGAEADREQASGIVERLDLALLRSRLP
jgi:DNA-binding SARP family transcriptional activator